MEEVLDTSLRTDHTTAGIHDPVKARKLALKGCYGVAQPLSSLTGNFGSGNGDQSTWSAGREEPTVAIGAGLYFQTLPSTPSLDSDCDTNELQNLLTLATVACELQSSIRHRQLVKKRRTPRKVLWINESSRITNCRKAIPPAGALKVTKRPRIGSLNAVHCNQPPWLQKSVQDTSALTSKPTCTSISNSSNTVIVRFGSQHGPLGKKIMARPPKNNRIKFNTVAKGNNRMPAVRSKPLDRKILPGKDTRVQGVAKRILQFVGDGSTAEKFIRGAFGNNPDTSKALRLLLTQRKVYRIGDGGRGKAFLYVATPAGLRELEQLQERDVISTDDDDSSKPHYSSKYQDGLQMPLKDSVSPSKNSDDGQLAPRDTLADVINCVTVAKRSHSVSQGVVGNNK